MFLTILIFNQDNGDVFRSNRLVDIVLATGQRIFDHVFSRWG